MREIGSSVDNNWKITGVYLDSSFKEAAFDMVKRGALAISTSEDRRALSVKALNIYEMIDEGLIKMTTYVVEAGDDLWVIAQKYGLTWKELNILNDLDNPRLLRPGMEIVVPMP